MGDNFESSPDKWFRSDWDSAITLLSKNLALPREEHNSLWRNKEGQWETTNLKCNYKEENGEERIVVNCQNKAKQVNYYSY
ncbi:hypothetical protein [Mycoplasma suis]|uniref:Uncharacterized protein n=2 Tax=Mycoplasma suis TaxID=57372 RepID=F0QQD3_MYCSL|nr:hypothetical protein [Mycoplasma suis]ADX97703.1 hypothetical protein MSU_0159 [Mycoplasma suis str. Illinois]CBZ40245.1 hypothetical protein MSUIS_01520 [Mycoplasma suis KI3806]